MKQNKINYPWLYNKPKSNITPNTKLKDLELSKGTIVKLERNGFIKVKHLSKIDSQQRLFKYRGFGKRTIAEIEFFEIVPYLKEYEYHYQI